jgi:hypothetical protein
MRDEMPSKLDVIAVSLRATRGVALSYRLCSPYHSQRAILAPIPTV